MNRILLFLCVLFLGIILYLVAKDSIFNAFKIKGSKAYHDVILEKTQSMGNLEVLKYYFKDVVEQRLERDYLPDPKALLIVHGEASACVNLKALEPSDISLRGDSILVKLPSPELCSYKIDHNRSRIYDSSNSFMNEDLLFEEAFKSAERQIKESALQSGILEKAKLQAKQVLEPLFSQIADKPTRIYF